jgi:hypothetical protein
MPGEATVPPDAFDQSAHDANEGGLGPLPVALPPDLPATSIEIALTRDGQRWTLLDGEPVQPPLESSVEQAIRELEQRGREHFDAFVVRVEAVASGGWELTIDAL